MKITTDNRYEWIEKYLENALNEEELHYFNTKLSEDEALRAELTAQQEAEAFIISSLELKRHQYQKDFQQLLSENPGLAEISEKDLRGGKSFFLGTKPNLWVAAVGLVLVSALVIYLVFIKPQPEIALPNPIAPGDTTQTPRQEPKNNNQITEKQDSMPSQEESLPTVQEKPVPDPLPATITEYRLRQSLGVAGSSNLSSGQRPVLIYRKSPSEQITNRGKIHYLFKPNDTLRFYGNVQVQALELLYVEPEARYYLKKGVDTLRLIQRSRWQELPE